MDPVALALIASAILAYGLISQRAGQSVLTAPMAFVALGFVIGPAGFDFLELEVGSAGLHLLAELTLVLVLFTDASRIDLTLLRREHNLPIRLLIVGLPLTVVAGTLAVFPLLPGLGFWGAAVLAAILAPTDAALGQAVVGSPIVPVRIRQALGVESGLNDGVMLPAILVLLSVGCATHESASAAFWLRFAALQVTLGPLVGLAVGWSGGKLIAGSARKGWSNRAFEGLAAPGLALLAYAVADLVGGNGFIAAFCAGLAMGNFAREICPVLHEFGEAEGQLLSAIVFLLLGAVILPQNLPFITWQAWVYAAISLTVVRMLPVAISLTGAGLRRPSLFFLGWFGPRGLASILFALLVVQESSLPGKQTIMAVVVATVVLSVFAHGLTAAPGTRRYSAVLARFGDKSDLGEQRHVTGMPIRGHAR